MSAAVFLSYASQDAAAARRICEALRSVGVEVWFDQSELRGGDAWDQRIRKQIRDCTLFVPVISANTQARTEGYFRLEWRLADQRTHLMAKGRPFLVPVVIDGTSDFEAHVPDSFMEVQWTHLSRGATDESFAARIGALLAPVSAVAGGDLTPGINQRQPQAHRPPKAASRLPLVPIAVAVLILLAAGGWLWLSRSPNPGEKAPAAARSPADDLVVKARASFATYGYTRESLAIGDDLARLATDADPASAAAWATRAQIGTIFLLRNWDTSDQRQRDIQEYAGRALALNRESGPAYFALGYVLLRQRAITEAAANFRHALEIEPNNSLFARAFGDVAWLSRSYKAEARAVLETATTRSPQDPLVDYNLARLVAGEPPEFPSDVAWALAHLDRGLSIAPIAGLQILKAAHLAGWRGDLPAARAVLDELDKRPLAERAESRAVSTSMWIGLLERNPDRVIAAGALTAKAYFDDAGGMVQSKDWLLAFAHRLAGKENLARIDLQNAETILRQRLSEATGSLRQDALWDVAETLALQGRVDEAIAMLAPVEAAWREDLTWGRAYTLGSFYGTLGDAGKAVPLLRRAINGVMYLTPRTLRLDPWWDKLRGQPEFESFVTEAEAAAKRVEAGTQSKP